MRVLDLISLGMEYLLLGMLLVAVLGIILFWGSKVYRKKYGSNVGTQLKKLFPYSVFLCYLVVVFGVTTLSRSGYYEDIVRLQLFYSYRDAWNDFSITEWRNIILNILMFVPLGFLLPAIHTKFRKAGWTYISGFVLTALIETVQMVFKLGVFELDDLLNNLTGTMIGYGVYRLLEALRICINKGKAAAEECCKSSVRINWLSVILYQMPLLIMIIVFSSIFIIYEKQELGNLHSEYIVKQKVNSVCSALEFSEEEMSLPVYQVPFVNVEQAKEQAGEFFTVMGDVLDEESADIYENTVIFWSKKNKNIWIEYKGGTFNYTDFELQFGEKVPKTDLNASEEEVRQMLESLGITLPEGMSFELCGDRYRFTADMILLDGLLYDGKIECKYTVEDSIAGMRNSLVIGYPYKEFAVISQSEGYRRLEAGEFYYPYEEEWNIEVYDAYLEYEIDSKGFYQPVYRFDAIINGEDGYITIPAIEKGTVQKKT